MIEILTGTILILLVTTIWSVAVLVSTRKTNKRLAQRVSNLDDAANESYVKFINESRDWAYAYIEEVQSGLKAYVDVVDPQLNYFNTYGKASGGIHELLLENITPAFEELKKLLPEDNKEK